MKTRMTGGEPGRVCDGFAYIEVVVVLVILGILAVFVIVGIRNTHADVVAEAGLMRAHLRFSQGMAMANNTATWSLLITDSSYTLQRDGMASPVHLPDESSATRTLPAGVRIVQGTGLVTFNECGDPGATTLISLTDGEHQENITIVGFTGLIP